MSHTNNKIQKLSATITLIVVAFVPFASAIAAGPTLPVKPVVPVYTETSPLKPVLPSAPVAPVTTEPSAVKTTPVKATTNAQPAPVNTSNILLPSSADGAPLIAPTDNSTLQSNQISSMGSTKPVTSNSDTNISVNNDGKVNNGVNLNADSGGNTAGYNTGNGSVKSGDANVVLSILNMINTVFISPDGGHVSLLFDNVTGNLMGDYVIDPNTNEAYSLTGSRLTLGNDTTGAGSVNNAFVNLGKSTDVHALNSGNANNNINLATNTGGNSANYNTGNGDVGSGNANVALNLMNFMNSTFIATEAGLLGVLNIFGNFVGNLLLPKDLLSANNGASPTSLSVTNKNTGANSANNASVDVTNKLDVNADNVCDIANNIDLKGSTGNNTSNFNTGNGFVNTGNVKANVGVASTANQTVADDTVFYTIINVLGKWTGSNLLTNFFGALSVPNPSGNGETIIVQNNNIGANAKNNANVDISNKQGINLTNNASINNNIVLAANTGGNSSSYNTGNGKVTSGNVNVLANVFNVANMNVVAKKFVFFVINIFGDWKGDIADRGSKTVDTGHVGDPGDANGTTTTVKSFVVKSPVNFSNYRRAFVVAEALAAPAEVQTTEVLAASTDTPAFAISTETPMNPILKFLSNNLWNILILLGVTFLVTSAYLYNKQRRETQLGGM